MGTLVKSLSFRTNSFAKGYLILAFLNGITSSTWSQGSANLVNNGGFEISYPGAGQSEGARYWTAIDSFPTFSHILFSLNPPLSNAPYSSFGFQYPKTGSNFIGTTFFYADPSQGYPVYPRNRLRAKLKPNTVYCSKYYVVNTNNNPYAIDRFGMHFADSTLDTITLSKIPLTYLVPQVDNQTGNIITDTLNWTAVGGTFTAQGQEKYLVLGNFHSVANTNSLMINPTYSNALLCDIYIDDVSCIEMELPAYAGPDVSILPGDSVFIGRESDVEIDESCQWFKLPNISTPIDTIAGLWVKPTTNTTYVVRQQLWCSGVKWDTVTVHINNVGLPENGKKNLEISIYPNPSNSYVTVSTGNSSSEILLTILDATGRVIEASVQRKNNNTFILNTGLLPNGLYFLRIVSEMTLVKRFVVAH